MSFALRKLIMSGVIHDDLFLGLLKAIECIARMTR